MFGKQRQEDATSYGIIGMGRFGSALACTLAEAGKEILVLDQDEAVSYTHLAVLLAIIWWSAGIVKKIPASVFLIAVFCLVSRAGVRTIFSFPLSETFPMIVMTYLFSQGIANSGLIDQIFQPLLLRLVHTPWQLSLIHI